MNTLITSLIVSFFLSFVADAANLIQVITGDGTVLKRELGVESEWLDIIHYRDNNKIGMILSSYYPEYGYNFADAVFIVAAPTGQTLQTGSYFEGIWDHNFHPDKPQLEWGVYDGIGNFGNPNGPSWFRVIEVNYTSPGFYNSMAVDANDGNGNLISMRYNSNAPLPIPEPAPILLSSLSLLFFWRRRRKLEGK